MLESKNILYHHWKKLIMVGMTACMLSGCGASMPKETVSVPATEHAAESTVTEENKEMTVDQGVTETTAEAAKEVTTAEAAENEAALEDLVKLVGMNDADTADLFGGGAENRNGEFYIGRNYKVTLNGEEYDAHTTCGDNGVVESVSLSLVSGERDVTDEEVEYWLEQVGALMGTEPAYDGTSSEGGSKNWKWVSDGMIASMYRMKDILSISFQPAVGELK